MRPRVTRWILRPRSGLGAFVFLIFAALGLALWSVDGGLIWAAIALGGGALFGGEVVFIVVPVQWVRFERWRERRRAFHSVDALARRRHG